MKSKNFMALLLLTVLAVATVPARNGTGNHFGAPFTKAKLVSLADLTAKAESYTGKTVKVKGTIKDVCQREGCWLVLTDGTRELRVSMKDHAFTVPKDAANKTVIVEGIIEKKTISEETARQYAEESAGMIDPHSIKGAQVILTLTATGVRING
ncbi:MAG: DUF4920 domain-containing protein [Acidobacteria bacterium]|nr:DUF4920 domain-containing protein [Acidobacteriota bacterium]